MNNEDTDIYSQSAIADGVEHAVVRVASGNASLRPSTRHTAIRQTNSSDISLKRWWTAPASDETAFDHLVPKGKGVSFVGRPLPELWIEGDRLPGKGVADMPPAPVGTPQAGPRDEGRERGRSSLLSSSAWHAW
ncbi:hypothetical protein LTR91_019391 [Friedmanniomyces endolithicus]|uniref:Uncharacterized protein n=2 Tax=Dothideomycetidae TaxID=451867 RepID=A0AAN6H9R7_9PEZI|nr:hypothetical protein LTS09_007493 [Friedmanniomyces endolithicus]KAK5140403.1 hypothetical protein LTR32_006786 [Rachicladosporium monterosium]KAK0775268.1 hypothetical protein LTR59_014570 [Friedmanniomyces endolithicus]KAK0792915.1 hypothetical protein LTR75_011323 [Friedmanniomyces endolithicus]KAK0794431.1 hypothetical protein LTR38_009192 [Friedmanniomyces endolithicus]